MFHSGLDTLAEQRIAHTCRGWRGIHKLKNKRFVRIYSVVCQSTRSSIFERLPRRAIDLAVSVDNIIDLSLTSTTNVPLSLVFTLKRFVNTFKKYCTTPNAIKQISISLSYA